MSIITTQEWHNEISKQFRYPGHIRLDVAITPDITKDDIQVSSVNNLPITDPMSTIDNRVDDCSPFATFEGIWRADGSMYLPSRDAAENLPSPLCSAQVVSEDNPMQITYVFSKPISFAGITAVWDTQHLSWPSQLSVHGYNSRSQEVYHISDLSAYAVKDVIDVAMDDVQSVLIEIVAWSNETLRARVSEIDFGVSVTLTDKDVIRATETTKMDFVCAQLPSSIHQYSVKNQIYRSTPAIGDHVCTNQPDGVVDISRIFNQNAATQGIATVEINNWKADGSLYLPSRLVEENINAPWMSENGEYSFDNPIEIVITYDKPTHFNRINFLWDNITNSWPAFAKLVCADSYENEVYSNSFSADGVKTTFTDLNVTAQYVKLYIYAWSVPGWRARINLYEASLSYGNNNIPSEVNNLFDPTLKVGYSKYLSERQKVLVSYGLELYDSTVLWLPAQTRFLSSWNIPADSTEVELQSDTRLSFMTSTYLKGEYVEEEVTLRDLALSVLESSNIIKDNASHEPWYVSEYLNDIWTSAPLPALAENAVLQLIAGVAGCTLSVDPVSGYVLLDESISDTGYVIDEKVQLQTPNVLIAEPLRSVSAYEYSYSIEQEESQLYEGYTYISGEQELTIRYTDGVCAAYCRAEVTGATIVSEKYYGYSAVLRLATSGGTTAAIKIIGYKVTTNKALVETYHDSKVASGRDIIIDNPLVTNGQTLAIATDTALDYYRKRSTVSTQYLGFPDICAGDVLALYSTYSNERGRVLEHTFTYNGAFNGSIKLLMEAN